MNKKSEEILNKNIYRKEFDGIRAFAVLAVIINHFNPKVFPSGYLGVDIFFIISGYVITSSLINRDYKNFKNFIISFFERRIKRLLPALIFFVMVISVVSCFFIPLDQGFLGYSIRSLLGISNISFYSNSLDYFATSTKLNPFAHTWSLAVEAQFYLVFPFLIWFTGYARGKRDRGKFFALVMLLMSISSLVSYLYLFPINQSAAYYLTPNRFWELASGSILFAFINKKTFHNTSIFKYIAPISSLVIIGIMFLPVTKGSGYLSVFLVFFTLVLISSIKFNNFILNIFTNKFVLKIGLMSYSLYLWHWGILSLSHLTIGISWWTIPIQILLIYYFALFSYKFIESPIRNSKVLIYKRYVILSGLICISLATLMIKFLLKPIRNNLFLGEQVQTFSDETFSSNRKRCNNKSKSFISNFNNRVSKFEFFDNCWLTKDGNIVKENNFTKKYFFYGNSYNEQLYPVYANALKGRDDLSINSFIVRSCMMSERISDENEFYTCSNLLTNYISYFKSYSRKGDSLVIPLSPAISNLINTKYLLSGNHISASNALNTHINELKNLTIEFQKEDKNLIIVSPFPLINQNPRLCLNWFAKFNRNCPRDIFDLKRNIEIQKIIKKYKSLEKYGLIYIDIFNPMQNILQTTHQNKLKYYYTNYHLSRKAILKLNGFLTEKLFY